VGVEQLDAALEEQDRLGLEVAALTEELDREKDIASNQIAVKDRQLEVKDQQIAEMQAEMARLRDEMQQLQTAPAEQRQNQSASATPWWQSPYVLGGALGVVVLLLVYALVAARRRRAEEDDFYPEVTAEDTLVVNRHEPVVAASAAGKEFADDEALIEDDTEGVTAPVAAQVPRGAAEETGSETNDVIGEADIYIAYGRYPQAIGLLLGVLEEDAGRNDVRLKLLELYAETRDREAFDVHMAELLERCEDDEALLTARELNGQFGDESAAVARSSDDLLDAGEQQDTGGMAGDDTREIGELDLTELDDLGAATDPAASVDSDEFELELDELAGDEADGQGSRPTSDALGGDLGIDFDPDRGHNGEAHPDTRDAGAAGAGSTDDLDLDLDLDDTGVLGDDAFDFDDEGDTAGTKLDLARAYIDMGDQDGARDILSEVMSEGNNEQQKRAQAMLEEL
jgi:pilus assembly protein FimV